MSNHRRSGSPSATFMGTLLGIAYTLVVPPAVAHPSEAGIVVRLLVFSGLGMLAGFIAEAILARRRRGPD
jgi:hypothetical protein